MGIAVAALAAAGLVVTSHMLWVDAFDRQAPRVRLSSSIREKTALAHLWLEEGIAGDRSVDPDRDVRAHLDEVLGLIRAARAGGPTPFGDVPPASDSGLRAHLDGLETQVLTLRESALQRWNDARGSGAPGMPRDQVFDQLFRETLALASTIGSEIDAAISRDRRAVLLTNGGIAMVFLGLLVGIHVVLGETPSRPREACRRARAEGRRTDERL